MDKANNKITYKYSGQDWLGQIPVDWKLSKIAALYELRNERVSDKDYPPLSVTMKGVVPQLESAAKTDNGDNRKLVKVGDFAINSRSDRRGSCGISKFDGSVSLINTVLTPRDKIHPGYYEWLFHSVSFGDEFYKWGHGIVDDLWTTRWQEMKRIVVPVPPYNEQGAIAAFLDEKCTQIDSLIAEEEKDIVDYQQLRASLVFETVTKGIDEVDKFVDTGIDVIGKIPEGWRVIKFGMIATVVTNLVPPEQYKEMPQVSSENIEKDSGILLPCKTVEETGVISNNHLFYKGQLLYSKIRPTLNKVCIAPFDGLCSADMYPIETEINAKYLMYAMLSRSFVEQVAAITSNRVKMPKINQEELKQIWLVVPDGNATQKRIVDFLDNKCENLNAIIKGKEKLIGDLEDYRRSIIMEAITGKRKVM